MDGPGPERDRGRLPLDPTSMKRFLVILFSALPMLLVLGCGEPQPDAAIEKSRLESAMRSQEIFRQAGGNWDSMSEADRTEFVAAFNGNEADARRSWDLMRSKSPGAATGSGSAPGASAGPR